MLYIYHPTNPHSYPGLQEDIQAWDDLNIPHGTNLHLIPAGSIVVPRYRMLPFGKELEQEILTGGSTMINTYQQHRNIADLSNWVYLLENFTPPAYTVQDLPYLPEGEYFVKGETNSIKNRWFDCCYAPNKKALPLIVRNNYLDSAVGTQTIYIRPYQHYRQIGEAIDGRPVYNETRVFIYKTTILSQGTYWTTQEGATEIQPLIPGELENTIQKVIKEINHLANFYVADFAEYPDGTWGVVELNDGTMSGLSDNNPETVWGNLKKLTN